MAILRFLVWLGDRLIIGGFYLFMMLVFSFVMDIILITSLVVSAAKQVSLRPHPWKDFTDALELTSDNTPREWFIRGLMVLWILAGVWVAYVLRYNAYMASLVR